MGHVVVKGLMLLLLCIVCSVFGETRARIELCGSGLS